MPNQSVFQTENKIQNVTENSTVEFSSLQNDELVQNNIEINKENMEVDQLEIMLEEKKKVVEGRFYISYSN